VTELERLLTWISGYDTRWFYYVHHRLSCKFFDFLMPRITHLGGAFCTLTILFAMLLSFQGDWRIWSSHALYALIISHLIAHVIKKGVHRKRPFDTFSNLRSFHHRLKDYSFPSGHTTAIFSIAVTYSLYHIHLAIILLPLAVLVGFSRTYLGFHYPTDCLAGAMIGSLTALFIVVFL
jgi:undecaprenyl-diphosphatase